MTHDRVRLPLRLSVPVCLPLLAGGCGFGTAAVASNTGGGSGSSPTPVISGLRVVDSQVPSVAALALTLVDPGGRPLAVELRYALPGEAPRLLTAAGENPRTLPSSDQGRTTTIPWRFTEEPDLLPSLQMIELVATLVEVPASATQSVRTLVGNDPPVVVAADYVPAGQDLSGNVEVGYTIRDSSGDPVTVDLELSLDGGASWGPASPLLDSGPTRTTSTGETRRILWDSRTDLGASDHEGVRLRLTPRDYYRPDGSGPDDPLVALETGEPLVLSPVRIDNNEEPIALLEEASFLVNPDDLRGVPVRYRLVDEEGDDLRVIFQWSRSRFDFPDLSALSLAELEQVMEDPGARAALRVCETYEDAVRGRLEVPVGGTARAATATVRLPELLGEANGLLARRDLVGRPIELLRPSRIPEPLGATLEQPVAALPLGDGTTGVLLEGVDSWRLSLVTLATGTPTNVLATGTGTPAVLAGVTSDEILVGSHVGDTWRLDRITLDPEEPTGARVEAVFVSDLASPAGTPRGLVALGSETYAVSVEDAVVLVDAANDPARLSILARDLAEPSGLLVDPSRPGHLLVAEHGADRLLRIHPSDGRLEDVTFERSDPGADGRERIEVVAFLGGALGGVGLGSPLGLARHPQGEGLLVLSDTGSGRELLQASLGASTGGELSSYATLPDEASALATGPDQLTLVVLPVRGDLAVGGGVEQVRTVESYDLATGTAELADGGLDLPAPRTGQPWRLRSDPFRVPRAGSEAPGSAAVFVWDTRDVPGSRVFLRATVLDTEGGLAGTSSTTKQIATGFEAPVFLGGPGLTDAPTRVRAADLDRDGDLDLVALSAGGQNAVIFHQTSPRQFSSTSIGGPSELPDPLDLAIGDVDGDGTPDLVTANGRGDHVAVHLQDAGGAFELGSTLGSSATTPCPFAVALADVDRDGDLDVLSANGDGDGLGLFLQPPGGFGGLAVPPSRLLGDPVTTNAPFGVLAGDLDLDGLVDVVSINGLGNDVAIFYGADATENAWPSTASLGGTADTLFPRSAVLADLDRDGRPDLGVACAQSDAIVGFLQPGDGFHDAQAPDLVLRAASATTFPFELAALDVDGNGETDVISAGVFSNRLTIFQQREDATFDPVPLLLGNAQELTGPQSVLAADLDGDGLPDVAAASTFGSDLAVYFQVDRGTRPDATTVFGGPETMNDPSAVTAADMDGDGDPDLLVSNAGSGSLAIFDQTAAGSIDPVPRVVGGPGTTDKPSMVRPIDVDGDGIMDLVSANEGGNEDLTVFRQALDGSFALAHTVGGGGVTPRPMDVAVADLDGDGRPDLTSADFRGGVNGLTLFHQDDLGGYSLPPVVLAEVADAGPGALRIADFDRDGRLDVVSSFGDADALAIYVQPSEGFGGASPIPPTVQLSGPGLNASLSVGVADVDGDGLLDVTSYSLDREEGHQVWLQGRHWDLTGMLAEPEGLTSLLGAGDHGSAVVADLDGDGDADLACATSDGVQVLRQTMGRFVTPPIDRGPFAGSQFDGLLSFDLDLDGDVDLIVTDRGTDTVRILWGGRREGGG